MRKLTIDSSVFISAFNTKDVFHNATIDFFRHLQKNDFIINIPIFIIVEVANILIKARQLKESRRYLDYFYAFNVIDLNRDTVLDILPALQKFRLKTGDAIIASTARNFGSVLITWDRRLIKGAKKYVDALTPTEYIKKL